MTRVFGQQNVIHPGQPRLGAACQGEHQPANDHRFALGLGETSLHLVEALDFGFSARGTGRPNHSVGQAVEDGPDVEHDLDNGQKRVVEQLGDGVEVGVVVIEPVHTARRQQETALNDDDTGHVLNDHVHR